jgi:flagellar hook assembly protein FlgD
MNLSRLFLACFFLAISGSPLWADPTPVVGTLVHLNHNRFNPGQGETVEIQGLSPVNNRVNIRVFNQAGVLIKDVLKDELPGTAIPFWDGRNQTQEIVATGVYIIIVTGFKLDKHFRIAVIR